LGLDGDEPCHYHSRPRETAKRGGTQINNNPPLLTGHRSAIDQDVDPPKRRARDIDQSLGLYALSQVHATGHDPTQSCRVLGCGLLDGAQVDVDGDDVRASVGKAQRCRKNRSSK
jgi:hypothetical protein